MAATFSGNAGSYVREHWRFLTTEGQMGGLDILRAIAVSAVFLNHFNWLPAGWLGVDLFFVLSGFLIGGAIIDQAERGTWSYRRFYWNRALRILPVYYLCILAKALLIGLPLSDDFGTAMASIAAAATFMQTSVIWYFGWHGADHNFIPGGSWSLVIEEYFYLLCPLLIVGTLSLVRNRVALLVVVLLACLAGPVVRYYANFNYPQDDIWWYFSAWLQFRSRFDTLAFGVLAAVLVRMHPPSWLARAVLLSAGLALFAAVIEYLYHSRMWVLSGQTTRTFALWGPFVLGAAFAGVLLGVYKLSCRSTLVVVVARMSFAIYLFHALLQEIYGAYFAQTWPPAFEWIKSLGSLDTTLLFVAATLVVCYLVSLLVEYPFIRMYRKAAPAPVREEGPAGAVLAG